MFRKFGIFNLPQPQKYYENFLETNRIFGLQKCHFWSDLDQIWEKLTIIGPICCFNYYAASITMSLQLLCHFNSIAIAESTTMSLQFYYYVASIILLCCFNYYVASITMSLQLLCRFNYYVASITMSLQLLCRFNSITMSLQLYYYIASITMSLQLYYYFA